MPLPVYPPVIPTSPSIIMAERGQHNYFFQNIQAITTTAPVPGFGANTYGAGTGCIVYGIPVCKAVEQYAQDYMCQVDVFTSTTGGNVGATVVVMGSLDGVAFYNLATVAVTGTGTIFSLAKVGGANAATPGIKVRYLTAAVTAYNGYGTPYDSLTGSFIL